MKQYTKKMLHVVQMVVYASLAVMSMVNADCKAGTGAAECIAGEWDTLEKKCICDCIISDYNTSLISISNLGSFGNLKHAEILYFDCVGESFSSGSWFVMCFDGLLNALQDGNTVEIANYSIQSDINNEIVSKLCTLPASVSSTTSTVLQTSETASASILLPTQFVSTSSRLNLSSTVVSSEVLSPTTTSLQMAFSSSSVDMNSFSAFSTETNNDSVIKTKTIIPTKTYSINSISLSASASSTASGINSSTSMFTETFISTQTTVFTMTTQLTTASKPSTSFKMDSLSSFSSVSTSILAPIQHDITPTMVSSMTTTSIQTLASSLSSEDISQVDFSTPTNLVTKRNDVFQTASQPITTTDIPSSASPAYSRNRSSSQDLITVSSTTSRTITAPSLTKSISLSTSESSTASELKPSTSMFTVTATNTSTKTLISTPTTVLTITTQLTTTSKPSTSFRMDSLPSSSSVSSSILAPIQHDITPTMVSSMTTTSIQSLESFLSSKDISQEGFSTPTNLVTKSNDMFQTASQPITTTDIPSSASPAYSSNRSSSEDLITVSSTQSRTITTSSLTKSISLSTSESSTASELKPSKSMFTVTAANTSTKTLISTPTTVLTITTQLTTTSKPSTSFRMDSLPSSSSVSTSILAQKPHDITPTMVSSMTSTSIQSLASSLSSKDISQVDCSTLTNLVTKSNDMFQTASQPITTTDIPISASPAYSSNRSASWELITVSSTPSRTITASSLTKSISLSSSVSSPESTINTSPSIFTETWKTTSSSTQSLSSTLTTTLDKIMPLITASKLSKSLRMDYLSSVSAVSISILASKRQDIKITIVSSLTTTSITTLVPPLPSKDSSELDFPAAFLPNLATKGNDILNTALLPVTTTDVPSLTNLMTKLSSMTPTYATSTVSPLSSRMESTFDSSSSSIAYDVTNRIVTVLSTRSVDNSETKRSGTSHLDCNLFLVFFIFLPITV